jgi:hypothetical protein
VTRMTGMTPGIVSHPLPSLPKSPGKNLPSTARIGTTQIHEQTAKKIRPPSRPEKSTSPRKRARAGHEDQKSETRQLSYGPTRSRNWFGPRKVKAAPARSARSGIRVVGRFEFIRGTATGGQADRCYNSDPTDPASAPLAMRNAENQSDYPDAQSR